MNNNVSFDLEDGTTVVFLTQGTRCIVDTDEWKNLKDFSWYAGGHKHRRYVTSQKTVAGKRTVYYMHRMITGCPDGLMVDHINHDTLDNRKQNLRVCTNQENQFNKKAKVTAKTNYKGVYFFRRTSRWYAQICLNGKNKHLGYYKTELEAAVAYNNAANRHYGAFSYLNPV